MTFFPDIELKVAKVDETNKGQTKKHRVIIKIMLTKDGAGQFMVRNANSVARLIG